MNLHLALLISLIAAPSLARAYTLDAAAVEGSVLIAQAHAQSEAARQDRDERVRRLYAETARRFCEDPDGITQEKLDSLPAYDKDLMQSVPEGLDACATFVYVSLGRGAGAESIRRHAAPQRPADLTRVPEPAAARAVEVITFTQMLPGVRAFAIASCRSTGETPMPAALKRSRETIVFIPSAEDEEANGLSEGLNVCELRLFRRMMSAVRYGDPRIMPQQLLRDLVREYTSPPGAFRPAGTTRPA